LAISKDLSLENVMLVDTLGYNLLSIRHLASIGYDCYFTYNHVKVFRSDNLKLVCVGDIEDNLYTVDFSKESMSSSTCLIAKVDEGWLWHLLVYWIPGYPGPPAPGPLQQPNFGLRSATKTEAQQRRPS
jgi:hypothetical protein